MSNELTLQSLLEAGAHFGHQTHKWNPKMKQYILALKNCYENGTDVDSRAGKVRKNFGLQMKFDLLLH